MNKKNVSYATKDDLNDVKKDVAEIKTLIVDIGSYMRQERATKEDYEKLRAEIKSDAAQFKDEILHELVKIREDFEVIKGHGDILENHEERICELEHQRQTPVFSHA